MRVLTNVLRPRRLARWALLPGFLALLGCAGPMSSSPLADFDSGSTVEQATTDSIPSAAEVGLDDTDEPAGDPAVERQASAAADEAADAESTADDDE